VRDGYTIMLGDTTVGIPATPGNTPGTISPIFPVRDGGDVHYVGYWEASADRFARIDPRVDVPLTNHPFIEGSLRKLEALGRRRRGDPHPFVGDNSGFRSWMTAIHDCAGEVLEQKLEAAR
jgi:metallo-beta-lactamase class B